MTGTFLAENQRDSFHTEPFYLYFVYLFPLEKGLFVEDLENYPDDDRYDMWNVDLGVLQL